MAEAHQINTWKGYADWKNRPALKGRHGGFLAASFVLVVEVLENLAFLANASNLVLYLTEFMNFSPSSAANTVTNFMGTAFLLALLGGFLADAFFTTYCIYPISATIELTVNGKKAALLFLGLYLVALGVGGIKGSLPSHGAEQFDESSQRGRKQRSTFFNYYVFCLSCGALVAVTLVVWVEDNKGWQWGFGISTAAILVSIPIFFLGSPLYKNKIPAGSPITTIFKVLAAAIYTTWVSNNPSKAVVNMNTSPSSSAHDATCGEQEEEEEVVDFKVNNAQIETTTITQDLNFLDRATMAARNPAGQPLSVVCTVGQVEDVKIVVKILPIFMSTVMLNCCLAQLSTFSVQQAATMNTQIGSFAVPPASLPVFPVLFIMAVAPLYNHLILPFSRKVTKTEMGITHLQRIGTGLILSVVAMAVAALVETKRKRVASDAGMLDTTAPLPITFLWISLQYLFLGSADLFSLAGMMEFFFTEFPFAMRSLATALSWVSLAMGYYLSSALVSIVNSVTASFRRTPWLLGSNLNHYRLERFYWLMCGLSGLNFFHYVFWARRYQYRSMRSNRQSEGISNN